MLYVTMRIPGNEKHDGILLAWSEGHMRIALEDCADVVELRELNGQWTRDDGTPVELDGVFTDRLWQLAYTAPGVLQPEVGVAQNQDGLMAAFVEGGHGALRTIAQSAPGFWN